jgi:hypothetical protein
MGWDRQPNGGVLPQRSRCLHHGDYRTAIHLFAGIHCLLCIHCSGGTVRTMTMTCTCWPNVRRFRSLTHSHTLCSSLLPPPFLFFSTAAAAAPLLRWLPCMTVEKRFSHIELLLGDPESGVVYPKPLDRPTNRTHHDGRPDQRAKDRGPGVVVVAAMID